MSRSTTTTRSRPSGARSARSATGTPTFLPTEGWQKRLAAGTVAVLGYFVLAPHLPALGDRDANGFLSAAVALLAVAGLVVTAVPARRHTGLLVAGGAAAAIAAAVLTAASAPEAASPFKALFAAAAGLALARFFFSPVIVYALAILAAGADALSVSAGPTHYLINEQPRSVDYLTLFLPHWGDSGGSQVGISDLLFMAVFLETAWRFGLRRRLTAAALSISLVASLAIAYWTDVAVPALPLLSAGLLLPNADLVWSSLRDVVRRWEDAEEV